MLTVSTPLQDVGIIGKNDNLTTHVVLNNTKYRIVDISSHDTSTTPNVKKEDGEPMDDALRERLFPAFAAADLSTLPHDQVNDLINQLLYPSQREGFWRQVDVADRYRVVAHTSKGGAGKTMLVSLYARLKNKELCVFGPPQIINAWEDDTKRVGTTLRCLMSVGVIKGKKTSKGISCNHNLLVRDENDEYTPTESLRALFSTPCVVAFDESHCAKTKETLNSKALTVIARVAYESGCVVMTITGTPASDAKDAEALIRLTGTAGFGPMIALKNKRDSYVSKAATPFVEFCQSIDPVATAAIMKRPLSPSSLSDILYKLYTAVVIPAVSVYVEVEKPPIHHYAVYVSLVDEPLVLATKADRTRNSAIAIAKQEGGNNRQKIYAANNKYDRRIETIKATYTVIDLVAYNMRAYPTAKSLFFLETHEAMYKLTELLAPLFNTSGKDDGLSNIIIVNSDTHKKQSDRRIVFDRYREDNDSLQAIVTSYACSGESVSLDDRVGNRPRIIYDLGSRRQEKKQQSHWRSNRVTSKSATYLYEILIDGIASERDKEDSSRNKERCMNTFIGRNVVRAN